MRHEVNVIELDFEGIVPVSCTGLDYYNKAGAGWWAAAAAAVSPYLEQ